MRANKSVGNEKNVYLEDILFVEKPDDLKSISSEISWSLLKLMKKPSCPMDMAKELGIHEQKVYYHIKKLKKAGFIEEVKTENRHGTLARFYITKSNVIGIKVPGEKIKKIKNNALKSNPLLEPFIMNGKVNFTIVVGSPEPHGPFRARASDASCAIDLALFLGSFTSGIKNANYKLDVEMRERDIKNNLILIGGPVANMVTKKINSKTPIRFLMKKDRSIYSHVSRKLYENDNSGYIILMDNPWAKGKKILLFAGKRFPGTRSTIMFFIKKMEKFFEGNRYDRNILARVVKGFDLNGDGVVDTADIME